MPLPRVKNDYYPSPDKLIRAWLATDTLLSTRDTILECCDGKGAISNMLRDSGHIVESTDITDGAGYDATTDEYWVDRSPDWVITNPPFNVATPIITHALAACKMGVIMILRASYLEPCKDRRHLLDNRISQVSYVNPRPRLRADTKGSDSSTVVFITWLKDKTEPTQEIKYLCDWNR